MWSIEGDINFKEALENLPFGQKRTSKSKQFVFFFVKHVYKGPYSKERCSSLCERYDILRKWNLPLIVLPNELFYDKSIDGYFFRFTNLAYQYMKKGFETEDHKESFSNYQYKIIKRVGLFKISDLLKTKGNEWIYDHVVEITKSLSAFYPLSIGDLHTCNILADVNEKTVHIIDFDQNRSTEGEGDFFFLSKAPAKKIDDRWKEILLSGNNLDTVINFVRSLSVDGDMMDKVKMVIEKLNLIRAEIPRVESGESDDAEPEEEKSHQLIGQMKFSGMFNSITYSGLKPDVAKSALQKYIRRGLVDEALKAGFELFRMSEVGGNAIVTNLYNRLSVIATEDIGPSNVPLVQRVLEKTLSGRPTAEEIYNIISSLATSSKTRILSHVAAAYSEYNIAKSRELGLEVCDIDTTFDNCIERGFWLTGDPEEIKEVANSFYYCLKEENENAFLFAQYYHNHFNNLKVKARNRRTKADIILWSLMRKVFDKQYIDFFNLLEKAYFTLSETAPFIRFAIFCSIYGVEEAGKCVNTEKVIKLDDLLRGNYTIKIGPYVIDKHTGQGRRSGKGRDEFVTEGAHVENEDERFDDEIMKEIYNN